MDISTSCNYDDSQCMGPYATMQHIRCDDVIGLFEIECHEKELQVYHKNPNDSEEMKVITKTRGENSIEVDKETFELPCSKIDKIGDGVWKRYVYIRVA